VRPATRLLITLALALGAAAQIPSSLYSGLVWRPIGTFRAGRVSAVGGALGRPGLFYMGAMQGGLWKSTNAGVTWVNVTDALPDVANVSAVVVAPSNSETIYFGTNARGPGMFRSDDGARTWRRLGLGDQRGVTAIVVDPHNPALVLAATGGGVFRSTDAGAHWSHTLGEQPALAAEEMAAPFDHPDVIFVSAGAARGGRGARGAGRGGAGGGLGLYRSGDEGLTWTRVETTGLPALGGFTVATNTNAQRLYSLDRGGLYRSDDGGRNWRLATADIHTASSHVYTDPRNPDLLYTVGTTMYRSTDGGKTLVAFKGEPGGDDPRELWIDPTDGTRMLYGGDQGAAVTLDRGATWSSWYNQPTAQFYHIAADQRFPYWVYGIQQDSDITATRTRGDFGQINPFDWAPAPGWETGYLAVDPLHGNVVYTNQNFGDLGRFWTNTWDSQVIYPGVGRNDLRRNANAPIVFSPQDPHTMYWATQYVMATSDGGDHFTAISPDLTVAPGVKPAAPLAGRAGRRGGGGTISALAPSPARTGAGVIWSGSTTGLVYLTRDNGKTWNPVTPAAAADAPVVSLAASHTDPATAWLAVEPAGDNHPYIYRTHDWGRSWQLTVTGLPTDEPTGSFVRVVIEDPERPGLLFAGTESGVYVSFDAGGRWSSLRLNAPNTSYRDLLIHGNDLVAGTYGRSSWILDDISPLRQVSAAMAAQPAVLFRPGAAYRLQRDNNWDTALPVEEPHAPNPPEGAILYYYLGAAPVGDVTLTVYDAAGHKVRSYSSQPLPPIEENPSPTADVAAYWIRPRLPLPATPGMHRVNWDLRWDDPPLLTHNYDQQMGAIAHDTPFMPQGAKALPGNYTIALTVDGKSYRQPLTVKEDPRVGETPAILAGMRRQLGLERKITAGMAASRAGYEQATALNAQIDAHSAAPGAPELETKLTALAGKLSETEVGAFGVSVPAQPSFAALNGALGALLEIVDYNSDMPPVAAQVAAYRKYCAGYNATLAAWHTLVSQDLAAFNHALAAQNQPPLAPRGNAPQGLACDHP